MKIRTIVACSALIAIACSSNKEPARTAQNEPVTMPEATSTGDMQNPDTPREGTMQEGTTMGQEPSPAPERAPARERSDADQSDTNTYGTDNNGTGAANRAAPATPPPPTPDDSARTAPDNTRTNKRDRGATTTPMDQSNSQSDLDVTQQIRKAVMADDSLSFSAKNVKIVTSNGKVTLRGVVNSDDERKTIAGEARRVAGDANVDDQIEVKK